jgi:hypothetical protein
MLLIIAGSSGSSVFIRLSWMLHMADPSLEMDAQR